MSEPADTDRPVAVVTGANRGIGLEVCRQLANRGYAAVLGSRSVERGAAAARPLIDEGLDVHVCQLDVADAASVERAAGWVALTFGRCDALVNNAAIEYDTDALATTADLERVHRAMETNLFGAWRTTLALLPLLRRATHPRIVNVSSEGGSLASMGPGTPAYHVTKAALHALTRTLSAELRAYGVLVTRSARDGPRPTWAAEADGPSARAPRASSGACYCPTTAPPAASSATAAGCPGEPRRATHLGKPGP
jgi:NAD(P)-dependent dehydrogenase (short-subunit alcohol dehydrogenase family)